MYRPTATSTRLSRNGIRQPQAMKASVPMMPLNSAISPVDRMMPMATPSCGQLAISPRRFWLPHSIDSRMEPPHSPPTAMPWKTRSRIRITGAA